MNKTVPNAKNWPENPNAKRLGVKRSGIRAIDEGTKYDIPGKLRNLVHRIEDGKLGEVRDMVVGFRCLVEGEIRVRTIYMGKGTMADLHQLACFLEKDTGE